MTHYLDTPHARNYMARYNAATWTPQPYVVLHSSESLPKLPRKGTRKPVQVRHVESGEVFPTLLAASQRYGINVVTLAKYMRGGIATRRGTFQEVRA